MDIRIHPDIQDPNLIWVACFLSFLVMILLIISYKRYRNATALIFIFACIFNILGHGGLAASVQLLPNNLPMQIWIANVAAVMLFYCIYCYLALVLIYLKFRSIPAVYVLFILLIGFLSLLPSLLNFEPPTLLPDGSYNFHRTFIADFMQFMIGVILFMGLFSVFVSGYRTSKVKVPLLLLATGISMCIISMPLIAASKSADLAIIFHYANVAGWVLTLGSFLLVGFSNRKNQNTEANQETNEISRVIHPPTTKG